MRMETGKRIVQSWNAKSPLEQEAACRRSSNFSMKDSSKKCSWKIQKGQLQELQIIRKLKTWTNTQDQHGPTWTTAFQTQIIFKGAMFTIQIKYIQICSFSFESLFTSHGLHAQGHASRLVPHPLGFTRHTLLLDKFVSISRLWDSGEADPVHVAPKTPRAWRLKAKTMIVYQIWWYDDMMPSWKCKAINQQKQFDLLSTCSIWWFNLDGSMVVGCCLDTLTSIVRYSVYLWAKLSEIGSSSPNALQRWLGSWGPHPRSRTTARKCRPRKTHLVSMAWPFVSGHNSHLVGCIGRIQEHCLREAEHR